ncbi:MAG: choline/glycine/proline betaine transport protein [Urechidicola sp.]|jgi:choline/glycine/proline betaine transport protein
MIVGAIPFSFMMILMGIALLKALYSDGLRDKEGEDVSGELSMQSV